MNVFILFLYVVLGAIGFLICAITISTVIFTIRKYGLKEFSQLAKVPLLLYNLISYLSYAVLFIVGIKYSDLDFGIAFIISSIVSAFIHLIIYLCLHNKIKTANSNASKEKAYEAYIEKKMQFFLAELKDLSLILKFDDTNKLFVELKKWYIDNNEICLKENPNLCTKIKCILNSGTITDHDKEILFELMQ